MKIAFLGAGNMARAIASGLISRGVCRGEELHCVSGTGKGAALMAERFGATIAATREAAIAASGIIILAFKPQHLETISAAEAAAAQGKLVVSILAGRRIDSLAATFPAARNIVRVMPNTPAQIGKGVSTFCYLRQPDAETATEVDALLASLGTAHRVEESQLHIATVINGCGPAFYFRIAQLLGEIAETHGLDQGLAIRLAAETGIGSLELLLQSGRPPQSLIDEVVSPNGVTHALLTSLDRHGFPQALTTSANDAVARSVALSQAK